MSKITTADLTEAARVFWASEISRIGPDWDTAEIMADFAASILEREGVCREICEAATSFHFEGEEVFIGITDEGGYVAERESVRESVDKQINVQIPRY